MHYEINVMHMCLANEKNICDTHSYIKNHYIKNNTMVERMSCILSTYDPITYRVNICYKPHCIKCPNNG